MFTKSVCARVVSVRCLGWGLQLTVLTGRIHRRCSLKTQQRCRRIKDFLERLILALADQQLATGIALLVAGGIKWYQNKDPSGQHSSAGAIGAAHGALIVALSSLASSSHLAGLINLRVYLRKHRTLAWIRIAMVAVYAFVLSFALRFTTTSYSRFMDYLGAMFGPSPIVLRLTYCLPLLMTLHLFWLGLIQLLDGPRIRFESCFRRRILPFARKWLGLGLVSRGLRSALSDGAYALLSKVVSATFWFLIFGHPFFICVIQLAITSLSAFSALTQKFIASKDPNFPCDLTTSAEENAWGFGQMLAMLLLLLPLLQGLETFSGNVLPKIATEPRS